VSYQFEINTRFYKVVAASGMETNDYVPDNGQKIFIVNAGVSSSEVPDTAASIIWDPTGTPEIIISSYGEIVQENIDKTFVGDGTKILRICLINDLTEPANMGAFYQAVKL